MKVSVIIPAYNGRDTIDNAIISTTYQIVASDIETIVVDDASTDGTPEYIEETYPYVKLIRLPENKGVSNARNVGMKNATGDYITFLDQDDFFSHYRMRRVFEVFGYCTDVVIHAYANFKGGKITYPKFTPSLSNPIDSIIRGTGDFNITPGCITLRVHERLPLPTFSGKMEDLSFTLEVLNRWRVTTIPDRLLNRRIHDNNHTSRSLDYKVETYNAFVNSIYYNPEGAKKFAGSCARHAYSMGMGKEARKWLLESGMSTKNAALFLTSFMPVTRRMITNNFNILGR